MSDNCEHRAMHGTNEKLQPGTEAEVEWTWILWFMFMCRMNKSNTTLLQCVTQIPPLLLPWRQAYLPSYGPPLHILQTYYFGLFSVGYLKDRAYANNPHTTDSLNKNIQTEVRRMLLEMLDRVITILNEWITSHSATNILNQAHY